MENQKQERPDPVRYVDLVQFLSDFLVYLKKTDSLYSVREFSRRAGLSVGYLSNVLARKRGISSKRIRRLTEALPLTASESTYIVKLHQAQSSSTNESRAKALQDLQRHRKYSELNPNETKIFRYLSKWYHVAIRELATQTDFQLEAKWIQQQLKHTVSIPQIESAIEFLLDSGYLKIDSNKKVNAPDHRIEAHSSILWVARTKFHSQMLELAKLAMEKTPEPLRAVKSHTFSADPEDLEKAKKILDRAIEEIAKLGAGSKKKCAIYHFTAALFPLTREERRSEA